ncbi:MAG: hypothetical protein IKK45_08270 [Akkermansia sp.]|nr:hypothetical protein [Akkermansia sp.]
MMEDLPPSQFFAFVVVFGVFLLLLAFIPVRLAALCREIHRNRTHLSCRICGFRFLRRGEDACCPHCGARNR